MFRKLVMLFCFAALVWMVPAGADDWNKKTTVTFGGAVELPGIVLPAGTYVFRLMNDNGNRHIVQVFNADESHLFTTILALPNYRLRPTSESVMRFNEAQRDNPEAMRAWFYPADNFGQEFVYPRERATELAASANVPVLTGAVTPTENPEEMIKEPVVAVTPQNEEVSAPSVTEALPLVAEATPAPVVAEATPAPEPVALAAAAPAPAEPAPAELPQTASPLPLLVLIGFGSLGVAGGLRVLAKRVA